MMAGFCEERMPCMAHEKRNASMLNGLRLVDGTTVVADLVADLQREMILSFVVIPFVF